MVKNTPIRQLFPQKKRRNRAEARSQIVEKNPAKRFFDSLIKRTCRGRCVFYCAFLLFFGSKTVCIVLLGVFEQLRKHGLGLRVVPPFMLPPAHKNDSEAGPPLKKSICGSFSKGRQPRYVHKLVISNSQGNRHSSGHPTIL